jgi:hypothetical protein
LGKVPARKGTSAVRRVRLGSLQQKCKKEKISSCGRTKVGPKATDGNKCPAQAQAKNVNPKLKDTNKRTMSSANLRKKVKIHGE